MPGESGITTSIQDAYIQLSLGSEEKLRDRRWINIKIRGIDAFLPPTTPIPWCVYHAVHSQLIHEEDTHDGWSTRIVCAGVQSIPFAADVFEAEAESLFHLRATFQLC